MKLGRRINGLDDRAVVTERQQPDIHGDHGAGMSDGVIAGIVVGSAALLVFLVLLGVFILHHRRRPQTPTSPMDNLPLEMLEPDTKEEAPPPDAYSYEPPPPITALQKSLITPWSPRNSQVIVKTSRRGPAPPPLSLWPKPETVNHDNGEVVEDLEPVSPKNITKKAIENDPSTRCRTPHLIPSPSPSTPKSKSSFATSTGSAVRHLSPLPGLQIKKDPHFSWTNPLRCSSTSSLHKVGGLLSGSAHSHSRSYTLDPITKPRADFPETRSKGKYFHMKGSGDVDEGSPSDKAKDQPKRKLSRRLSKPKRRSRSNSQPLTPLTAQMRGEPAPDVPPRPATSAETTIPTRERYSLFPPPPPPPKDPKNIVHFRGHSRSKAKSGERGKMHSRNPSQTSNHRGHSRSGSRASSRTDLRYKEPPPVPVSTYNKAHSRTPSGKSQASKDSGYHTYHGSLSHQGGRNGGHGQQASGGNGKDERHGSQSSDESARTVKPPTPFPGLMAMTLPNEEKKEKEMQKESSDESDSATKPPTPFPNLKAMTFPTEEKEIQTEKDRIASTMTSKTNSTTPSVFKQHPGTRIDFKGGFI
ncbi:MAG: hypothetical protein M1834_001012 [Cirrosporium novae-zelandiae]|nr:MAG: hypothetical protein M1834_001012 [Cirrosporium novae-zelandiae]